MKKPAIASWRCRSGRICAWWPTGSRSPARAARLVELDPRYADAIIRRWQNYTGLQAVRADGVKFDDIRPRMMAA